MTDDIVKRLHGPRTEQGGLWPIPNLHEEAADEIEKLRAENGKLRGEITEYEEYNLTLQSAGHWHDKAVETLKSETEKLRAALKAAFLDGWYRGNNLRCTTHNAELDWEVSTTKAALKEMED